MKRFKNILFVADGIKGEATALKKALELAELNRARLSVISVVDAASKFSYPLNTTEIVLSIQKNLVQYRKQGLQELVREALTGSKKTQPSLIVQEGRNFVEIIRTVLKDEYDLVIKLAGGEHKLSNILFGSLDLHLLRKCPCPVWILKPRKRIAHSRILAAVDIAPQEKASFVLNNTIMELACSLSEMENGKLGVINAWFLPEEAWLRTRQLSKYKSVDTLLRECRTQQKKNLNSLVEGFSAYNPELHLIKGHPGKVIPRFINNHRVDLLVMGTLARTGVAGLLMGNTAEKILNSVNCSVLAIKPQGFRSPVKI